MRIIKAASASDYGSAGFGFLSSPQKSRWMMAIFSSSCVKSLYPLTQGKLCLPLLHNLEDEVICKNICNYITEVSMQKPILTTAAFLQEYVWIICFRGFSIY